MHRTSILLPDDLREQAEKVAQDLGITLSELIRRQLASQVGQTKTSKRASDPLFTPGKLMHPRSSAGDFAARHDDYLYGAKRAK